MNLLSAWGDALPDDFGNVPEEMPGIDCDSVHPLIAEMMDEAGIGELDLEFELEDRQIQFTECIAVEIANRLTALIYALGDSGGIGELDIDDLIDMLAESGRFALEFDKRQRRHLNIDADLRSACRMAHELLTTGGDSEKTERVRIALGRALDGE